jgi:(E)-4-hydroxy-3-methylbut-2-enyl-diphosphate synthase
MRRKTRKVMVGKLPIGGDSKISIQSMTKTDTRDVTSTVNQIKELEKVGCDLVRVAVPDREAAEALGEIKKRINLPLVADIHFDYRLAIEAMEEGVDKVRINPGNIGGREKIEKIAKKAKERGIPIRIGVNSGSLNRKRYGEVSPENLVKSCIECVEIFEALNFRDLVLSIKTPDVHTTILSYRELAKEVDYPFHIGLTATGPKEKGIIKSTAALSILLSEGFGDTIRVSLTGSPVDEVKVAHEILKALHLRDSTYELISCPTCGRCEVDLVKLVREVDKMLPNIFIGPKKHPPKIAIMGCVVNGPWEAREADVGVAFGRGTGVIFRAGEVVGKVKGDEVLGALMNEIKSLFN